METLLPVFLIIFPIAYFGVQALLPSFRGHPLVFAGAGLSSALCVLCLLSGEDLVWNLVEFDSAGDKSIFTLALRFDALSGLLASVVLTIGAVLLRFSVRYMADSARQQYFEYCLACTLSCVLALLMAPNFLLFGIAWALSCVFVNRLLSFFPERTRALKAAAQKRRLDCLAGTLFIAASTLFFLNFGSFEFDTIFNELRNNPVEYVNGTCIFASLLLVAFVLLVSAQFPTHYWLPNSVDTATPVSALLHAGIINAGGYLLVRFGPVLEHTPMALLPLILIGGLTAVSSALIMMTQTDVKKQLAYSTISQMGFMMLQCGVGAFALATVHLIGHAFYKAYAFLSSGTAVERSLLLRFFPESAEKHESPLNTLTGLACSLALLMLIAWIFGVGIESKMETLVLLLVLTLALCQIMLSTTSKSQALLFSLLLCVSYFGFYQCAQYVLEGIDLVSQAPIPPLNITAGLLVTMMFAALFLIQRNISWINRTKIGRRAYVQFYNAFYWRKV